MLYDSAGFDGDLPTVQKYIPMFLDDIVAFTYDLYLDLLRILYEWVYYHHHLVTIRSIIFE